MSKLSDLYAQLRSKPGLQNINFTESDLENFAPATGLSEHDLDWLESALYLDKVYGVSMDTPANQIPKNIFNNVMADPNYRFYVDDADVGLYSNGYIGDLPPSKIKELQKTPEYWSNFYKSMY